MNNVRIAGLIDKHTKYKVSGIDGTFGGTLRDLNGVILDFETFRGYESVGKVIVKDNGVNVITMRLNARKKLFGINEKNMKIYGYVSSSHAYLIIYSLNNPLVTYRVFKDSKLIHSEDAVYMDIRDYAKEFEQRG